MPGRNSPTSSLLTEQPNKTKETTIRRWFVLFGLVFGDPGEARTSEHGRED